MSVNSVDSTRAPNGGSSDVDESAAPATGKTPSGRTSVSEGKAPWTAERNETLKAQGDVLIEQAENGTGQFDLPRFHKGLTADERALMDKAADLEAQGLGDAAWCLKLEVLESIDNRASKAMGAGGKDIHDGVKSDGTANGSDLGADVADAKAFAKQAFFESLPVAAESMTGEEFALAMTDFLVAMSSIDHKNLTPAEQSKMKKSLEFGLTVGQFKRLEALMDSYVYNSANGNADAAASSVLSMSNAMIEILEKGVVATDGSADKKTFGLVDQIKDLAQTKFNGVVLDNARVAKTWVRGEMAFVMEQLAMGEASEIPGDQLQAMLIRQATLDEKVGDLYSIWQSAFQLAAR